MRSLSKSKLLSFRQCPKRLWLEVHRPDERADSAATQASFAVGNRVGDIARQIYDPEGAGELLDPQRDGFEYAFSRTAELLDSSRPIFEAAFSIDGALSLADVMLPVKRKGKRAWRMVEVKSSTEVKDYHRDDVAIQAYIARQAGVELASISLAHIDNGWIYPGNGDYQGLLCECDLTAEAQSRAGEVEEWVAAAHKVAAKKSEPKICTGGQCVEPYECGFIEYCQSQEPQAKYPVRWLPSIQAKALKDFIATQQALDMRQTPDDLLSKLQLRVKQHTLSGEVYFDSQGAAAALKAHKLPAYFLDFETIQFAVPIWKGARPYQMIPFQFSLHVLNSKGRLSTKAFLDVSSKDPSKAFAESLIDSCGEKGPIFVYNAGFEGARIDELAQRFKKLAPALRAIRARLVDLHPVTKAHYYHPDQCGSWSIKAVLPTVAPELSYEALNGVKDGGMAMDAYLEAIHPETTPERKREIEGQLLAYCGLDTYAMVRLWQFLTGRNETIN